MTSKSAHKSGTPRQEKASKPVLTETETPLDFSWCAISSLADVENEEPRPLLKKKVCKVPVKRENEEGEEEEVELYPSTCLKLNNNCIEDISDMMNILDKLVVNPAAITYVNLAMNELKKIDACLCDLPGLKMLFLEGNHIADIAEVEKLGGCPNLVKLALHGNPMETTKNYRKQVLGWVPGLRSLDMSAVTKSDRANAEVWKKCNPQKKKKKHSHED